jgi:ribonucleoside-diphosphate reductase alpha chain
MGDWMDKMIDPHFDDNALTVLRERYLWKDANGEVVETPKQMLVRVASAVSSIEADEDKEIWFERFYTMMAHLDFLPNSPTLMNAGRGGGYGQLSACYVIDVEDSMEGIFNALKKQALIHKSGGGTGFNFSNLRSEGDLVKSTNGRASGPVSFMRLFDLATDVVQQGGMRRGANMGILDCYHPDVLKFITAKNSGQVLQNFNISVSATDRFMEAVFEGKPVETEIFETIVDSAWRTGDPGLLFIDTINETNPTLETLGPLNAVNPCGESPLYGDEACNLGSINLANMVTEGLVDYSTLCNTVRYAVRFLDNVITINEYPLPEIKAAVEKTRKIGLGVMGWAEMLYQLRIPYDSQEAVDLAERVMLCIKNTADLASSALADERGRYPAAPNRDMRRNATVTCIAPTGTISLIAGCSSGIEPLFALRHKRVAFAEDGAEGKELWYSNAYYEEALRSVMSKSELDRVFVTSHKISPVWHIKMQAAFQRYTDMAVSKTINLPNNATREDIHRCFIFSWLNGCKGVTVYRDGCKQKQVLYVSEEEKCPVCGATVVHEEGCKKCSTCSWGMCSV